jgi:hypothetical protein
VGARAALPVLGMARLVASLARSNEREAKRLALTGAVHVGAGALVGAGFAVLRERFAVPESALVGAGLGALAWAITRAVARHQAPAFASQIVFGLAVERGTRLPG